MRYKEKKYMYGGIGLLFLVVAVIIALRPTDSGDHSLVKENSLAVPKVTAIAEIDDLMMEGKYAGSDDVVSKKQEREGSTPVIEEFQDESFIDIYAQARKTNDRSRQFEVVHTMYMDTQNALLLPYLINMAVQLREYEQALVYVAKLESEGQLHTVVDPQSLFSLLFNGLEMNFKDIARIKDLLGKYKYNDFIEEHDFNLWSSLITYSRGDLENYKHFMGQLSGTVHETRNNEYLKNEQTVAGFTDPPDSYLEGLTALQVFSHGYYQVARAASYRIMLENETYILPRQIYGYASVLLGDWSKVIETMRRLLNKDSDNEQLYSFLAGIAHFELEQYSEAILILKDIRDDYFLADARRYLLLSYVALEQYTSMGNTLNGIISSSSFLPHDFFTLFDMFFYIPLREDTDPLMYNLFSEEARELIQLCYTNISQEYAFICLWGKSGLLLTTGEEKKAYAYLQRLVRWYPKSFLFEALGDIAFSEGNVTEAKGRFIKAISVEQDDVLKQEVMHKVRSAILQTK